MAQVVYNMTGFTKTIHSDIFLLENHEGGGQGGEVWEISPQHPGTILVQKGMTRPVLQRLAVTNI